MEVKESNSLTSTILHASTGWFDVAVSLNKIFKTGNASTIAAAAAFPNFANRLP